jgi:hypothetical protein
MAQQASARVVVVPHLVWLRRILVVKIIACLALWGLPFLLAPLSILALLGLVVPAEPGALLGLRALGSLNLALALLYWYAYQDPVRNVAILRFSILANTLSAVTMVVLGLTVGVPMLAWFSAALMVFFAVSFAVLMPRE